jgi:hypothetical protein
MRRRTQSSSTIPSFSNIISEVIMSQLLSVFTYQPDYSQITSSTIQLSDGDYVLAGRAFDSGTNSSAVAIRVHPNGLPVFQKTYSGQYAMFFAAITQIADGTLVATGTKFNSNMAGDEDIWIANIDDTGNIIRERTFGSSGYQNDGYAVAATSDGGFIISGLNLQHGPTSMPTTVVMKFDANFNLQWENQFTGGIAFAIRQTKDGGYILSGAHNISGSLNSNPYALRLDANGNPVWEKYYQDYQIYVLLQSDITETSNGTFAMVAKSVMMEIDANGNLIWATPSNDMSLGTIEQLSDGNFAIGGSLIVNYYDHAYVAVIGSDGKTIIWDNTELLYPSGVAQLLVNSDGFVTAGGYAPLAGDQTLMFLSIYYPAGSIGAIPQGAALSAATDIN